MRTFARACISLLEGFFIVITGVVAVSFLLGACSQIRPTTGLFDKGTHTGTVTLLRVDHSLATPDRRFLPLRYKADVAGLNRHDRIVTDQDLVTISLKSAFVKYFKEFGGKGRKGEIAVVLSFSAGTSVRDSFLIHSTQGQTLGSLLNLDDWPIIGPVKIDGDSLLIRVAVIELDKAENEQIKQVIRGLAGLVATLQPEASAAVSIAHSIAELLISLNSDDVILDQRFTLRRVDPGRSNSLTPLLFGTYVLILQEDSLRGDDATVVAPRAVLPPVLSDLRFDRYSQRIYKVYSYYPRLATIKLKDPSKCLDYSPDLPLPSGVWLEGTGPTDWASFYTDADIDPNRENLTYRKCMLDKWVNRGVAKDVRMKKLGYKNGKLSDFDLHWDLDHALQVAFDEGIRHKVVREKVDDAESFIKTFKSYQQPSGEFFFEYPLTAYPEGFTLLAQYPLHTHLILSVDRSLGGEGGAIHDKFQSYKEFLEEELKSVRDRNRAGKLTQALQAAINTRRRQAFLFKKVASLQDSEEAKKVCLLAQELPDPNDDKTLVPIFSDAPIYNEMFHVTGRLWRSKAEVLAYLGEKKCNPKTCNDCASEASEGS